MDIKKLEQFKKQTDISFAFVKGYHEIDEFLTDIKQYLKRIEKYTYKTKEFISVYLKIIRNTAKEYGIKDFTKDGKYYRKLIEIINNIIEKNKKEV